MTELAAPEYEMQRKSQEFDWDSDTEVDPRVVLRELVCPICLDVLKQTMAVMGCLHRFCSACINKALRTGNKECPTCRKKLTSRRCLRPDPNFDQLISKLYNGEHARPQESSKVIIAPECEIVLRSLKGQRTRYIKCAHEATVDHLSKYLSMRPDCNKMPELNKDEEYRLCIVANHAQGHYEMLPGSMTLEEIKDKFALQSSRPLELYFYVSNKE